MEMGASQLAVRIVGSIGRINQGHLRTGKLSDDEWPRLTEAIEKLRHVSLSIDETPGLTPSELRTATMAAEGHSNKAIADALVLSPKTVEFHLGNVYRKLGVANRTALARVLADQLDASGSVPSTA